MRIRLEFNGTVMHATLEDNATARDFASLLPLTLMLNDFASTEKVADLPRRLSTNGAPPGSTPAACDIAYYAPWGNLALFYRGFAYSTGLVKLGVLDDDIAAFRDPGSHTVTIERLTP
jgi:hypothetical protein